MLIYSMGFCILFYFWFAVFSVSTIFIKLRSTNCVSHKQKVNILLVPMILEVLREVNVI